MKYPVIVNEVAFVKTTDEPVFVLSIDGEQVLARRTRATSEGAVYETEGFGLAELVSEKTRLVRELEFTTFSLAQRKKASDAYDASLMEVPKIAKAAGGSLLN
jgi:hypothetical protein